ncbi:hypothetical protein ACFL2U_01385 [Patescibacteria group bacterium]
MTAIQPNEKFSAFLQKCGLTSAMIICEGELCEDYIQSLSLQDCLQIYKEVRTDHQIIPALEKTILAQCYTFADWQKVFEASATKDLHEVALIKMCELAQQPTEFHSIMHRITHLDKSFVQEIFARWIAVANSFWPLKNLWYDYANNNRYPLRRFKDPIVLKMANYAKDYEQWKIIYNLINNDFPQESIELAELKLIQLSSSMDFSMLISIAHYVKTEKLIQHVSTRLEQVGTFADWAKTFKNHPSPSFKSFWQLREQQLLKLASCLSDWLFIYRNVRNHKDQARMQIVKLAKTYEDWFSILGSFHWSFHDDDALAMIAMQEVVNRATTWEQLDFLLGKTEHKPEFHDKILAALLELDKTLDKWADIIKWAGHLYYAELQQKIVKIAQTQLQV